MGRICTPLIIAPLIFVVLVSCGGQMNQMDTSDATPVIRTDFSDEETWKKIQADVAATHGPGSSANVHFIETRQYDGLTAEELLQRVPDPNNYGCIFVADAMAMVSAEHHLLVLDPINPTRETFRVIPSEVWAVESNLSLANMDYSEFADSVDPDGVFRGFK